MRPSYYLLTGFSALITVGLIFALYHYKADRWGVFADDFQSFHQRIVINKLYLKTRFLLSTDHDYNCFVFGSSRVAAIDVKRLGDRCYNFTHSGGLVVDHLEAVKRLLEAGTDIEEVFVALDDLSYNEDPEVARLQHMRRGYPVTLLERLDFFSMFMLKPIDVADLSLVTGQNPKIDIPRFIVDPDLDTERIRGRYQKFFDDPRKTDIRFRRLAGMGEGSHYFGDTTITALRELRSLAHKYGFSVTAFFLPLHYKTYLTRDYESLRRFKSDASAILSFRDFSGLNSYTTDNRYWRETSHFSAAVGDRIVESMNSGQMVEPGMGRLVTSERLAQLEQRQLELDLYFLPLLMRREGLMPLPPRYLERWRELSKIAPVKVKQRPTSAGSGELNIAGGGSVRIRRGDDSVFRQASAVLNVRKGEYFTLEYGFQSRYPAQFRLQLGQDDNQYEGRFKEFRLHAKPGQNQGLFAGYASVDRPLIKLMLGGGDIEVDWQPLVGNKIRLSRAARQRAELFDSEYEREAGSNAL
jgi:hypothetical protein